MISSGAWQVGHGGARPGAGRPPGTRNALPKGAAKTLKAHRRFVKLGPDATRGQLEAAMEAEQALLEVLRSDWKKPGAHARITSAAAVLDRAAGAVTKPVTVASPDGGPLRVSFSLDTTAADAQSAAPAVITAGSAANVLPACSFEADLASDGEGER